MWRMVRAALLCCGVLLIVRPAAAQSPWYISVDGGVFLRSDASKSTTITNDAQGLRGPGTTDATFNAGPEFNLAVGYKLPVGIRIELELDYAHDSIASASPTSSDGAFPNLVGRRLSTLSGGGRDYFAGMVNMFYDFPITERIVPYAGLGLGIDNEVAQTAIFSGPGVARFTGKGGTATQFVIQAELGVAVSLTPNWAVVPAYRFEHGFASGTSYPLNASVVKVGLRYGF